MATIIAGDRPSPATARHAAIDLTGDSLGLSTAPHIRAAAKRALDAGETHYTTRPGLDPLREAVSRMLAERGVSVDPKLEIIVTSGSQEALFIALQVLIEPGDEIVVIRPSRRAYVDIARHAGAKVRAVRGDPAAHFAVDPDRVARALTPATRVLVLGSPLVPAGTSHREDVLLRLAELAVNANLAVVADETFAPFVYDGEHRSVASLPGMAERTITVGGFSLAYALHGWRVGYMAGPRHLMVSMMKLKQALSICSAAVSQFAALAALTGPQAPLHEAYALLGTRRDVAFAVLDRAGIRYVRSAAGPYLMVDGSPAGRPDRSLARAIASEAGVKLAPGSNFGLPSWLRLSLTQPEPVLEEAIARLEPILGGSEPHGD